MRNRAEEKVVTNPVALPDKLTHIPIFDTDTHWVEPADLWTSRAPAKYKDRVMHVRRDEQGAEAWHVGGECIAPVGAAVVRSDLTKEHGAFSLLTHEAMSRACIYANDRVSIMDKLGVGSQILYPNAIGFGAATLLKMGSDEELRLFHIRAYNDALADVQKESGNRILGQMVLPLWDLDACVTEIKRCRDMGLTGIAMSDKPKSWGQPVLADPKWDHFWSTCQDLDAAVNFHVASGTFEDAVGDNSFWGDQSYVYSRDAEAMRANGPFGAYQSTTLFMSNQSDILNLLTTGVLERFPKLRFVSVESGLSWVPFCILALERALTELMSKAERAQFKRTPREAFKEQIFVTFWFENRNCIDFYLSEFGADNLMFETDFPHPVSMYPETQAQVHASLGHLDEDIQRKILYKNAERVYGVPVGAVRE